MNYLLQDIKMLYLSKGVIVLSKKEKKNHKLERRDKIFLLVGAILLLLLIIVIYFAFFKKSNLSATDISKKMSKEIDSIESYKMVDPDEIAGEKHEYVEKTYIYDEDIEHSSNDWLASSASIEVFKNDSDAKLRYDYLNKYYEEYEETFSKEDFGDKIVKKIPNKKYLYLNGNVLLQINENASNSEINEYKNVLKKILRRNKYDKSSYSKKELDKEKKNNNKEIESTIKEEKEELLNDLNSKLDNMLTDLDNCSETDMYKIQRNVKDYAGVSIIKEKYDSVISKINTRKQNNVNDVNNRINNLYSTLDSNELQSIKDKIEEYTDEFYETYKSDWQTKLDDIENKINEKQRQEEIARKTKTLSNGNYTVGVDIESGTYDLIAVSGGGNVIIYDSLGGLEVNEIMGTRDSSFYSKTYNNVYLGSGYKIELKNGVTIKFQAK